MANFDLHVIPVTPLAQNCSLLWDTQTLEGVLVDPGGEVDKILHEVDSRGITLKQIWITHGHLDHAGGADEIRQRRQIEIVGPHADDQFWLDTIEASWAQYGYPDMGRNMVPDRYLTDGDQLSLGHITFDVAHTPGHTPGHVVIYNQSLKIAFVGDVLFQGSIGRTDFPKGDHSQLIQSICTKLWPLGGDMRFVPGHGPMSTFATERASNPFVSDRVLNTRS